MVFRSTVAWETLICGAERLKPTLPRSGQHSAGVEIRDSAGDLATRPRSLSLGFLICKMKMINTNTTGCRV